MSTDFTIQNQSLDWQLKRLVDVANRSGLPDAADYLQRHLESVEMDRALKAQLAEILAAINNSPDKSYYHNAVINAQPEILRGENGKEVSLKVKEKCRDLRHEVAELVVGAHKRELAIFYAQSVYAKHISKRS